MSPINTCAGCKLNNKNPSADPITIQPKIVVSFTFHIIDITVNAVKIIVVTLVDNPSIPSVKLTAFVVDKITATAKNY